MFVFCSHLKHEDGHMQLPTLRQLQPLDERARHAPRVLREQKGIRRPVSRVLYRRRANPDRRWPFVWDARCRTPRATYPDDGAITRLAPVSRPLPPLHGLAPGGVCRAATVAGRAVRSYRTLSPLPALRPEAPGRRSALCGTVPGVAPAGCYPAPRDRGARTFLHPDPKVRTAAIRPSGSRPAGKRRYGWGQAAAESIRRESRLVVSEEAGRSSASGSKCRRNARSAASGSRTS